MTVAEYLRVIAPTFSPSTAATYGTYWHLAVDHFGDRRLGEVTVDDCAAVVAEAARRAQSNRASSDGRASRENCVSALRALFTRAQRAGLIAVKPPRGCPSRDDGRAGAAPSITLRWRSSSTRCVPPVAIPTSTCSWSGSTSSQAPAQKARSTCVSATSTTTAPPHGFARSSAPNANSRSRRRWSGCSPATPPHGALRRPRAMRSTSERKLAFGEHRLGRGLRSLWVCATDPCDRIGEAGSRVCLEHW